MEFNPNAAEFIPSRFNTNVREFVPEHQKNGVSDADINDDIMAIIHYKLMKPMTKFRRIGDSCPKDIEESKRSIFMRNYLLQYENNPSNMGILDAMFITFMGSSIAKFNPNVTSRDSDIWTQYRKRSKQSTMHLFKDMKSRCRYGKKMELDLINKAKLQERIQRCCAMQETMWNFFVNNHHRQISKNNILDNCFNSNDPDEMLDSIMNHGSMGFDGKPLNWYDSYIKCIHARIFVLCHALGQNHYRIAYKELWGLTGDIMMLFAVFDCMTIDSSFEISKYMKLAHTICIMINILVWHLVWTQKKNSYGKPVVSKEKYYQMYPNAGNNLRWFREAGFGIIVKLQRELINDYSRKK
jgi:hypothetical protein